jgi:hypothetical protein
MIAIIGLLIAVAICGCLVDTFVHPERYHLTKGRTRPNSRELLRARGARRYPPQKRYDRNRTNVDSA